MKNMMIYLHPEKKFDIESERLVKVQVDNSISLGWKPIDILLITNFDFQYNGVMAYIVPDNLYCSFYKQGTKENVLSYLFTHGFEMHKDEIFWLHDLDAFESDSVNPVLGMGNADMALCDYGRMERWNTGSVFFKNSAKDIIIAWTNVMNEFQAGDEQALIMLTNRTSKEKMERYKLPYKPSKIPIIKNIKDRIVKLNISYNFVPFNLRNNYKQTIKPIKVVHFHPLRGSTPIGVKNLFDFYAGKNKINTVLMSKTLLRAFHYHRFMPS